MSEHVPGPEKQTAGDLLRKLGDTEGLPLVDSAHMAKRDPKHKWDLMTKNILKSLFDCILQGRVKDFALVVEMSEAGDKIFYKSRNGKKLIKWAAEKKEE